MLKEAFRRLKAQFRTKAASSIISDVMRDLSVASVIGAVIYMFPNAGGANVVRALALLMAAAVCLIASVVLKGDPK